MHHFPGFILVLTCFTLAILPGYATGKVNDEKLRIAFQAAKVIEPGDCNPTLTRQTLQFLKTNNSDLKKPDLTGNSAFPVDCSFRKTDFNKLRLFMWKSGYLQNPGSLHLINDQDTNLKLKCGKKGMTAGWRVLNLNTEKEDNDFNDDGHMADHLNIVAPVGYRYFRTFSCFSIKEKCTHTFYVVTRPHPKLQFPLQAMEGNPAEFYCRISGCTTGVKKNEDHEEDGCEIGGKDVTPVVHAPYTMELRVPKSIFKNPKNLTIDHPFVMPACKDENPDDADDDGSERIYLKLPLEGNNVTMEFVGGVKIKMEKNSTKKNGIPVGFTVNIDKASKENHPGFYECVVIDDNGIPSLPKTGTFTTHRRFSGKTKLHVRPFIMMIIPAVIIGAILVLMLIIWLIFRKNDKMENDDGTQYAKESAVTPVEPPKAEKAESDTKPNKPKKE